MYKVKVKDITGTFEVQAVAYNLEGDTARFFNDEGVIICSLYKVDSVEVYHDIQSTHE